MWAPQIAQGRRQQPSCPSKQDSEQEAPLLSFQDQAQKGPGSSGRKLAKTKVALSSKSQAQLEPARTKQMIA